MGCKVAGLTAMGGKQSIERQAAEQDMVWDCTWPGSWKARGCRTSVACLFNSVQTTRPDTCMPRSEAHICLPCTCRPAHVHPEP